MQGASPPMVERRLSALATEANGLLVHQTKLSAWTGGATGLLSVHVDKV